MNNPDTKKDFEHEDNLDNYQRKPKFTDFVVPEDGTEVLEISVEWNEALEFANPDDEITKEELQELGLQKD